VDAPGRRDLATQPEPPGRPERAEPVADLRRAVLERLRLVARDAVDRAGDGDLERQRLGVDRGTQALGFPGEPLARVFEVPDQATRLSPVSGEKK
jgi:hypothetical protein